jgi:hypothetical protein
MLAHRVENFWPNSGNLIPAKRALAIRSGFAREGLGRLYFLVLVDRPLSGGLEQVAILG